MSAALTNDIIVQFSLVPAADAFVPIILDAVEGVAAIEGLKVETDAVSSTLVGAREPVLAALSRTFARASASGAHIVQPLLASHGPAGDDAAGVAFLDLSGFVAPPPSNVKAAAQFLLLPERADLRPAIDARARDFLGGLGLATRAKQLATRVDGDASLVLAALLWLLERTGRVAGETVLQATLVSNSPATEAFA